MSAPIFLVPPTPPGYQWASVELGIDITTSPGGAKFVEQVKASGIAVIVDPDGGMSAKWIPKQNLDANAKTPSTTTEAPPQDES